MSKDNAVICSLRDMAKKKWKGEEGLPLPIEKRSFFLAQIIKRHSRFLYKNTVKSKLCHFTSR